MSDIELGTGLVRTAVDTSGIEAGVNAGVTKIKTLGKAGAEAGREASEGIARIGAEADATGQKVSAGIATSIKRAISESQRALAELQAGSKGDGSYFESLLSIKNVDARPLKSLIEQLDDYKSTLSVAAAQERNFAAADAFDAKHEAAKKLVRDAEYVNAYAAALDAAEAKEREFAAAKLSVAAAQEKELAAAKAFSSQHESARRSVRESEYSKIFAPVIERESRTAGQNSFLNNLEQEALAAGKTRSELLELKAAQLGVGDSAAPYIAKLRAIETGHHGTAMSAKQLAYAMRLIPAQFTDIATSIAAGQSPLVVLMQQGGQLKDMFGGIGPAARAMSTYVAGLVNPFTVAAAAVGSLAMAYRSGSKESEELQKQLIFTGTAATTSLTQIYAMADKVSGATGGGKGGIAETIGQIVSTGKVSSQVMTDVAEAATRMNQVAGKAVGDTIKEFAEIGKGPTEAVLKLDEQYRFLTADLYKQIRALEEQGKVSEAANVAQKALADELNSRAKEAERNLGNVSKTLLEIERSASQAWSAIKNIGRDTGGNVSADLLAKAKATLEGKSYFTGGLAFGGEQEARSIIALSEAQAEAEKKRSDAADKTEEKRKAGLKWSAEENKYLTKRQQMEQEVTAARELGNKAGASQVEIEQRIASIRSKYKETGGERRQSGASIIADLDKDIAVKQAAIAETEKLSAAEQKAMEVMVGFRDGTIKATDAEKERIATRLEGLIALEKEQAFVTAVKSAEQANVGQRQSMLEQIRLLEQQNELYGLTEAQISAVWQSRLQDAISIAEQNGATKEQIEYLKEELKTRSMLTDALSKNDASKYEKLDIDRQRSAEMRNEINLAKELGLTFTSAFEDAIAGGKGFQAILQSLAQDITKLLIRKSVTEPLLKSFSGIDFGSAIGNFFGFGGGSGTSTPTESWIDAGGLAGVPSSMKRLPSIAQQVANDASAMVERRPSEIVRKGNAAIDAQRSGSANLGLSVVVINQGAPVAVKSQRQTIDSRGRPTLEMTVDAMAAEGVARSGSAMSGALESRYGARPALVGR